ncbi:MAG: right-handed parallel beta-helix repeat-containing protein, partial [Candidatus Moraniibacteriota bacterium]
AKEGTDVHISKGTYKENITLPKGVKLFGKKKDIGNVVIKADNEDKPAVTMKHQTEINFLTIEGGRHGVRILEDAKAKVYKVKVKKSGRDGIHIDAAPRDKKHRALLDTVEVETSNRTGIFSEKRDIVIINSDIHDNKSDGIDLAAGMEAWFEKNRINNNKGSGLKVMLDGASVWTKSNSIRNNKREGVEVNAYGAAGNIGLKKADIIGNGRYGVARIARTTKGFKSFGGIILGTGVNDNRIETNSIGNTSPILRGF